MIDIIALLVSYGLLGLFIVNILSSSILPIPSEPAIILATATYGPYITLFVTLIGAMIGSITSYIVGYTGLRLLIFRRDKEKEPKSKKWLEKYGLWSLIIVQWVPFIGDPLMVLMGMIKIDFKKFLIFLFIGELIKAVGVILLGEAVLSFVV